MRTITLPVLLVLLAATPAAADGAMPEAFQGVWAAARDCNDNLQNVLPSVVNRKTAVCRVLQVVKSTRPETSSSAVYLNCEGSASREIWLSEQVEGSDFLAIVRFEKGAQTGAASIDLYKRCPGIPIAEIALSDITGNPVAAPAAAKPVAAPAQRAQNARRRPPRRLRAARPRRSQP